MVNDSLTAKSDLFQTIEAEKKTKLKRKHSDPMIKVEMHK